MSKDLFRYKLEADDEVAILYIIHGFADYCGRYDHFRDYLVKNNISFYGHDQEGHGKTTVGTRAFIKRFDTYVDDTIEELQAIKKEKPNIPVFVFGHSMGGLIAIRIALQNPQLVNGLILSAPLIKLSDNVSPFMRNLAWGMGSIMPKFYLPYASIDRDKLTPNLEYREKDAKDPLIWHAGVRAGMAIQIFTAVEDTRNKLNELEVKTVIFHGTNDDVCDISGSRELVELQPDIVELIPLELNYHSLLHLMPEDSEDIMRQMCEKIKCIATS